MHNFLQTSDDEPPLLNTLGLYLFWIQFGLGLSLFLGLAIAIGLLIWCQKKNKHRPAQRADPELAESNPNQPVEPNPEGKVCTDQRPTISGPINNLNSAWDEAESDSESIYNEPMDDEPLESDYKNPFEGWAVASSFRPVGPPPPPPQAIPMVARPIAKKDKSTMTPQGFPKARTEIQSGYMASPDTSLDTSLERTAGVRLKQKGNSLNRSLAPNEGPSCELPPLPQRSSSLRRKKRGGRKKNASRAATMS